MNYKDKLEKYLVNKINTSQEELSNVDSLLYSVSSKDYNSIKHQKSEDYFSESLGIQLKNYKRTFEDCLGRDLKLNDTVRLLII